jgi:hypothetical protein
LVENCTDNRVLTRILWRRLGVGRGREYRNSDQCGE